MMKASSVIHDTFVIDKTFDAPPARVFEAYADVRAREQWGAPGGDAIGYSAADFRVGGGDSFLCGPTADLKYAGTVRYEDIVENTRIVFTETIRADDKTISVSMTTWELLPEGTRTRLIATTQMISFVGSAMVESSRSGTNAALDNLVRWLGRTAAAAHAHVQFTRVSVVSDEARGPGNRS